MRDPRLDSVERLPDEISIAGVTCWLRIKKRPERFLETKHKKIWMVRYITKLSKEHPCHDSKIKYRKVIQRSGSTLEATSIKMLEGLNNLPKRTKRVNR